MIIYKSTEKYPRGRRGSPAKGVVWQNRSEGSNPSFSARKGLSEHRRVKKRYSGSFYFTKRRDAMKSVLFLCNTSSFFGFADGKNTDVK